MGKMVLVAGVGAVVGVGARSLLRDPILPQREARLLRGERARVRRDDILGALLFALAGAIAGLYGSVP